MTNTENKPDSTVVSCPQCEKPVPWTEASPYRPFCSKRCQLIDFGDWAHERNTIPATEPPDDFDPEAGVDPAFRNDFPDSE